jgi:glyoxylase-like metal-dependent hydrolase (beta-lactamase superfamily II)
VSTQPVTGHPETVVVTGAAQREAWQQGVLPPAEEVRPGLWSIPVPIPDSPLRYTLAYAFCEDTGVVVVDPGWDTPRGRLALTTGLARAGASLGEVAGVVVTHVHYDHHGASAWLRETSGAWVAMHPAEAESLPSRLWERRSHDSDTNWLLAHGVPAAEVSTLQAGPERIAEVLKLAEPDRYLEDGDRVPLTGRDLRAVWTPGHTPGHLCLHDAAAGIVLTGDHLLPRISPNIGVHGAPETSPLTSYVSSLREMARFQAEEALPAHEYRFRNVDARAAQLLAHHEERAAEVLAAAGSAGEPTAWAIAARLTWSRGWAALPGLARRMALAETLAHLHYLAAGGAISATPGRPVRWLPPG